MPAGQVGCVVDGYGAGEERVGLGANGRAKEAEDLQGFRAAGRRRRGGTGRVEPPERRPKP